MNFLSGVRRRLLSGIFLLIGVAAGSALAATGDDNWSADFFLPGLDLPPCAYAVLGADLFLGGAFTTAGPVIANHVVRFDGTAWHALGEGVDGKVWSLVVFGDDVIACGDFTHAGDAAATHVARWDGAAWHAMGAGVQDTVRALAVHDGQLWCDRYRWTGTEWEEMFVTDGAILDFSAWNGLLVAAGDFASAGGVATGHVLGWDGTAVVNAFPGQQSEVYDLEASGGRLYTLSGMCSLKEWSGTAWQTVPLPPVPGPILGPPYGSPALANWRDALVMSVTGSSMIACVCCERSYGVVASYDGTSWQEVRPMDGGAVPTFVGVWGDDLLIGGHFGSWYGVAGPCLVRTDGATARPLSAGGLGLYGPVLDLAAGDGLAIGGWIRLAGESPRWGVTLWDGVAYQARDLVPTAYGQAVGWCGGVLRCVSGDPEGCWSDLVWDAPNWRSYPWPHGMDGPGRALTEWAGRLYLARQGDVIDATDLAQRSVLADLTAEDGVRFLAVWDDRLVAAGGFTTIGGVPAAHIAAYDGSQWSPLGDGLTERVEVCRAWGTRLAAVTQRVLPENGGNACRVWTWDGQAWLNVGDEFAGEVTCLQGVGDDLFVGGTFTAPGGEGVSHIARWDGQQWGAMGSGVNGAVNALAFYDGNLWVGGRFNRAGGKPAGNLVTWSPTTVPVVLRSLRGERATAARVRLSWRVEGLSSGRFLVSRIVAGSAPVALPSVAVTERGEYAVEDAAAPALALVYRLSHEDVQGQVRELGTLEVAPAALPAATALAAPYPNPFNPSGTLRFALARPGHVRLSVYDLQGRCVAKLVDADLPASEHEAAWRGVSDDGRALASGTYVVRLVTDDGTRSAKLSLVR